jgi:hypothetical protein
VIQKNELYFCNQGSNVIQNQLSKSKHRLKSFVLQACVIEVFFEPFRLLCHLFKSDKKKKISTIQRQFFRQSSGIYWMIQFFFNALATLAV